MPQTYTTVLNGRHMSLPSTPPLIPDGPMDGNQSPSTVSTQSTVSGPQTYYLGSSISSIDSHHRSAYSESNIPKPLAITSQPTVSPYPTPQYTPSSFVSSPTAMAGSPYYDSHLVSGAAGMYAQRPLPSNFPPPLTSLQFGAPAPPPPPGSGGPHASSSHGGGGGGGHGHHHHHHHHHAGHQNPWQHHHYISASAQSNFPQSQDRYVCPTCNKAFSRPSSLRIHSHSHTGEKPFKCSHVGCGKAFSVRSNMKRHERGCHAAGASAVSVS
jgi:uncharacterized Zn-finger protein